MNEQYVDDLNKIDIFPIGKMFRISYDNTMNCLRIIAKSRDAFEELRDAFSVENKAAFFSRQYGYHGEPKLYNINKFGFFMTGLVYDVLEWIKTQYGSLNPVAISKNCADYIALATKPLKGKINCEDKRVFNIADDSGINLKLKNDNCGRQELKMRPYQEAAVKALIFDGYGRGLIEIPTAGGKSFIISNFIWNLLKTIDSSFVTLILVPNVQLVEQFYGDLLEYGFKKEQLAKFEGGMSKREQAENNINSAKIIIANRQYVFKNEKKLPNIDVLVCDEVHSVLAESTMALISRIPAKIRVGCSGTIPTDKYQKNQLIGMFGKIVYREEITELQNDGFISKLHITSIDVFDRQVDADRNLLFNVYSNKKYIADDPEGCDIKFDDAVRAEHDYITKWHKEIYAPVLEYISKLHGNTLILFDKLDIGKNLFDFFVETYPDRKTFYNDGSTDVKDREGVRTSLEDSDGNILFANVQIMSTGISIKRLHNLVFCFSSKSTVRIIQSCGRALRLHGSKDHANLYDVHFNYKYSNRHYKERQKLYKEYYKKSKPDEIVKIII